MKIFHKRVSVNLPFLFSFICITVASVFMLFVHYEIGGETLGYWFFARIFSETSTFIIPDRSPLYILYLQLFRPLGYPTMIAVEFAVTLVFVCSILVLFLKKYVGYFLATFGVLLWIPYLAVSEPPVQNIALALFCIGVMMRTGIRSRKSIIWSYVCFLSAYLFRTNYILGILVFLSWDCLLVIKTLRITSAIRFKPNIKTDWPLMLFSLLFLWINLYQSPHRMNNIWFGTTTWFPSNGKVADFLQPFNISYIHKFSLDSEEVDFYFTNKEVFDGASSNIGALLANPGFIAETIWGYMLAGFPMVSNMTLVPKLLHLPDGPVYPHIAYVGILFLIAIRSVKITEMRLYVLASFLITISAILIYPKARYFTHLVPVYIIVSGLSANFISKLIGKQQRRIGRGAGVLVGLIFILILSSGKTSTLYSDELVASWPTIFTSIYSDYTINDLKILEYRKTSPYYMPMKASYKKINELARDCRGVMSFEHTFLGAFTEVPIKNIYDIWEIPPFGSYNEKNTLYDGLVPEKINCIILSRNLEYGVGAGTNTVHRLHYYIRQYVAYLKSIGATEETIGGYGTVYKLKI